MSKLLVSFATRPGQGSEGGVGWEFLKAAAHLCQSLKEELFVILDARDAASVSEELDRLLLLGHVTLVPVRVPSPILRIHGNRRTRASYLAWLPAAVTAARRVVRREGIDVAHQVTFATATLPSVVGALTGVKTVWGPVNVPASVVGSASPTWPWAGRGRLQVMQAMGKLNASGIDTLVATNANSARVLQKRSNNLRLEPNIVAEPMLGIPSGRRDDLLTYCGGLIELKRPWIAVQAMTDPALQGLKLQLVGDGPLKSSLESYVRQERIDHRVVFHGQLPKEAAVQRIAESRLLVHPSIREGASWVVGEAAAVGVAAVVFEGTGADSTVKLCGNGGVICTSEPQELVGSFVAGIRQALDNPQPEPSARWAAQRLPELINDWWSN